MKKTTLNLFKVAAVFTFSLVLTSCEKDDPNPTAVDEPTAVTSYDNGVFITCEGPFNSGAGTGTVSFYNRLSNAVSNDVYNAVNFVPLGNTVQSMEVYNGKSYIVVNNAGKVEVVNASTMASTAKITGLAYPRYFIGIDSNKGYVSQWGNTTSNQGILVINLATNTVTALIPTGAGPEKMVKSGNFVYVVNSGGYGSDSTVTVINSTTDAIVTTLAVGGNPNSLVTDKNGKIWVLCGGIPNFLNPADGTQGKLICIDPATNTIEAGLTFVSHSDHPSNLVINKAKDKLLYLENFSSGKLFAFDITDSTLSTTAIANRSFYSIGVDPVTDQIFTGVTNYSNGWVLRYSSGAAFVDSFQVGIIPGNFYFK